MRHAKIKVRLGDGLAKGRVTKRLGAYSGASAADCGRIVSPNFDATK